MNPLWAIPATMPRRTGDGAPVSPFCRSALRRPRGGRKGGRMKLYVGNLAFSTSAADLRALFEQAGAVESCELVTDKFSGQSRGFAFVEMESSAAGARAIERFNDFEFAGRRMAVNEARPREARAGGFGGNFSGGFGGGSAERGAGGGPGGPGGFGARRKSGKGSRRNARSAKRDRKACW